LSVGRSIRERTQSGIWVVVVVVVVVVVSVAAVVILFLLPLLLCIKKYCIPEERRLPLF